MQLRRAEVLRGARALLDDQGLDGLTLAALGALLEAPAGRLDQLFPSRRALLDVIAAELVSGVAATPPAGPWDQRLATLAHRLRRALLGARDGARLVAETFVADPETVRTGARILVEDAGFADDQATWAVLTLSHYVLGHTIEEQSQDTADAGRRFEFGLGLILDGIRRLV